MKKSLREKAFFDSLNTALRRIAATLRFGINPKERGWAARGELGR